MENKLDILENELANNRSHSISELDLMEIFADERDLKHWEKVRNFITGVHPRNRYVEWFSRKPSNIKITIKEDFDTSKKDFIFSGTASIEEFWNWKENAHSINNSCRVRLHNFLLNNPAELIE